MQSLCGKYSTPPWHWISLSSSDESSCGFAVGWGISIGLGGASVGLASWGADVDAVVACVGFAVVVGFVEPSDDGVLGGLAHSGY